MMSKIYAWLPAALMMVVIFAFSSIPSTEMPNFNWADLVIKKGGHMLGYGMLALSYWYGISRGRHLSASTVKLAWLLAVFYAITDEFHQSFVAGRTASWVDVGIDAVGAALALFLFSWWQKQRRQGKTPQALP